MTKIELTKTVVSIVVGSGTTKVVHSVIRNNVQPETITDKVAIASSAIVLGQMAADATKMYTNAKIDSAVYWWNTNVKNNSNP